MLTDTKLQSIKPPATGQQEHPDHKVTGLRLRVGAGGKKTWTLRRRVGAKVVNRKLGTYPAMGLAGARSAAGKAIEAMERDGGTQGLDRTFGAVAGRWVEDSAKQKNKRWADQERQLELHVLPHWRERKIGEIKRRDVRDLIEGIEGKVLPNRILALVRPIFRFALSRDWIDASPSEGIEPPRKETVRERVLDMGEIARLWAAAPLLGYPSGQFVRMLLLTAQRRTEVASMRWADVDLKAATWIIPAGETKSARSQLVPLSPAAVATLKEVPEIGPFVFSTDGETHVSNFAKSKARLDEFLRATGGAMAPWRLHDLRRTAATEMVRLGVPELVVSRVLNHAVQGVTGKYYALHSYAPEKRQALDAWAAEVDRAVNGDKGANVVSLGAGE